MTNRMHRKSLEEKMTAFRAAIISLAPDILCDEEIYDDTADDTDMFMILAIAQAMGKVIK